MTDETPTTRQDQVPDELVENQLRQLLGGHPVGAPAYLKARIVANLPEEKTPLIITWLRESLWRSALACLLPVAFGFGLGYLSYAQEGFPTEEVLYSNISAEYLIDEI